MSSFPVIRETYQFECTLCGNCCTGPQKVKLDLFDLWKIGRFLNFKNSRELFIHNWVRLVQEEHGVWIPEIRFRKKPFEFCPFLRNEPDDTGELKGLCKLHPDNKPIICALAPVGREIEFDSGKEEFMLVPPAKDCPGMEAELANRLSDTRSSYANELELQYRFLRLLNNLSGTTYSENEYFSKLYSFDLADNIQKIFEDKELAFL